MAVLLALFWALPWFGLIDLLVVVEQDQLFAQDYLMESGWGLLYVVLVTVPLVALAWRPGRRVPLDQLWACTAAVLVGGVWGYAWPQLVTGLGLAVSAGLLEWLGHAPRPRLVAPDRVLGVLALLALVAAVPYGAPLARNTTRVEDITNGVSHYPMQAALGLALAGVAGVAALHRSRLPVWTAAGCAAWLGVESVVYPDLVASLGVLGGWAALAWAVALVVAGERARRRPVPRH